MTASMSMTFTFIVIILGVYIFVKCFELAFNGEEKCYRNDLL